MKNIQKGFTLIELLIVIGIIAILAAAIIIAINPGAQFAQARDATRQGHINSLNKAILSYMVSNYGDLSGLGITPTATEICAPNALDCTGLVDLSLLVSGGHLSTIPTDPSGGVDSNGSGYFISQFRNTASISSYGSETRNIGLGPCPPTLKDIRDNQVYKTVQIGSQCWMAENLNYDNGCTGVAWNGTDVGWCGVPQSPEPCTLGVDCVAQEGFGLLYQWSAAMAGDTTEGSQGICPTGWHLPTDTQWNTLEQYVVSVINSSNTQYPCSTSETGWRRCADNTGTDAGANGVGQALKQLGIGSGVGLGTDLVSFTAKLPGYRSYTDGRFRYFGTDGNWWSSTPSSGDAWCRYLHSSYSTVGRGAVNQGYGFSVRCLRD
ncbi:MAG: FISUMP domain-containing protein [Candidatus Pacebacteria bacterium]|nr:FISUMP domain-containing protein [Candidatus Paceibacterota bacterium]